jgi:hypothetical protein
MDKKHDIGIVLVGYDPDRTEGGIWVPGKYSRSRIDATAIKYKELIAQGNRPYVLPTGGKLAWWAPALADIIGTTLVEKLGIPYEIVVEENFGAERRALNTAQNVSLPLEDLAERGIYHVLFIGNDFQVRRITKLCRVYGRDNQTLEVLAAEDIIENSDPSRKLEMEALKRKAMEEGLYEYHDGWRSRLLDTKGGATILTIGAYAKKALSIFRRPPWVIEAAQKKKGLR